MNGLLTRRRANASFDMSKGLFKEGVSEDVEGQGIIKIIGHFLKRINDPVRGPNP